MIVKRENFYWKNHMEIRRTSWWLLGIIPIFVNNEVVYK